MKSKSMSWIQLPIIIYILLFIINYVGSEHNIYYWDYSNYWHSWINFHELMMSDAENAFKQLLYSVKVSDYNMFPSLFTSFFANININSRVGYILSLFIVYIIPLSFLFYKVLKPFFNVSNESFFIVSTIYSLLFCAFWTPTLRGLPDIGGMIFILLAIYINNRSDFSYINIKNAFLLGGNLWLAFVFRRWYVYTIIPLFFSLPVLNFYLYKNDWNIKYLIKVLFNYGISALSIIFLLYLFQKDLVLRILATNYSEIYSAYQGNMGQAIYALFHYIGGYVFILAGLSFFVILKNKKIAVLYIFCLFNLCASFLLFTRTQLPGIHHIIPFAFWCCCLSIISIVYLINLFKSDRLKHILVFLFIFLNLKIHYNVFSSKDEYSRTLYPDKALPLFINNYSQYKDMTKKLMDLGMKGEKIAVISSSSDNGLNSEMLNSISGLNLSKYLTYNSHVDLRDGIDINGLTSATLFVVPNIAQMHLNENGQQVISIPSRSITNKQNIGAALEKIDNVKYTLGNGAETFFYSKIRGFSIQEINELLDVFYISYPEWRNKYNLPILKTFMSSKISLGDIWGTFYYENGAILVHPGENKPTIVDFEIDKSLKKLKIDPIGTCNLDDYLAIEISNDKIIEKYTLSKRAPLFIDVDRFIGQRIKFSISKGHFSYCGAVKVYAIS